MREIYEFRIPEQWACEWLEPGDGSRTKTGSVRIVTTVKDSGLYARVMSAQAERRKVNDRFYLSWSVRREYEPAEIESGQLFRLSIYNVFEPPGEAFGAVYLPDVDGPAEFANRVGPLVLKCSRFRGNSFCQSIAGEKVTAPEAQALITKHGFTGVSFEPVVCKGGEISRSGWAELIIKSRMVTVSSRTLVGEDPLDFSPTRARDNSDHIGLNVLSEVSIDRATWDGSDFAASQQTVGMHNGYLRPRRLVFISKRVLQALPPQMKRGLGFEIVHFA